MLKDIWHKHKSSIVLVAIVLLIVSLPTFLYLKLKSLESNNQDAVSVAQKQPAPTSPESTQNQIASLTDNNCTAQVIACDQQFKDNKTLACGTFKGQVVDELLTRDESPCKGMDRAYVEAQLNEACSKGCLPTPTPTKTPTPTPSPTASPTPTTEAPTATPTPSPSPTPIQDASPTPTTPNSFVLGNISFSLPGIGLNNFENNAPKNLVRTIYATLYNSSTNAVVTQAESTFSYNTANGKYKGDITFNAPKNVAYYATIRTSSSLTKKVTASVSVTLVSGDLNEDNQMTIEDYNAMISCYKLLPSCSNSMNTKSDLNDDGAIDIDDINIMQRAFSTGKGELTGD